MWPAATSTTIPSGSFRPSLTIVFKLEPSGFDVRTRPAARSKKYKRPTVFAAAFAVFVLEIIDDIEFLPFDLLFNFFLRDSFIKARNPPNSSNKPNVSFHRPHDPAPPSSRAL